MYIAIPDILPCGHSQFWLVLVSSGLGDTIYCIHYLVGQPGTTETYTVVFLPRNVSIRS